MSVRFKPQLWLEHQYGHLSNWLPVFLAIGIGLYFSIPIEPTSQDFATIILVATGLTVLAFYGSRSHRPYIMAIVAIGFGFSIAGYRAHSVQAPVLSKPYYGAIEGRIVNIDRSATNKTRVTIDQVKLDLFKGESPALVRISIQNTNSDFQPLPGIRVMLTGYLSPPQGPVEPRGFDFRRNAWFKQLGGVGYSRAPILILAPAQNDPDLYIFKIRKFIFNYVTQHLFPETGAFAGAIITGDRSKIDRDTIDNLRKSNLAHLLAISGLHMGLLTGFVFSATRFAFALVPPFALRYPTKKIAALIALVSATLYLVISGASIATERAYIMVAVMLVAVVVERRAFSLRSVALAATIILIHRPEALIGAGFQMSFAATTALISTYGWLTKYPMHNIPTPIRTIVMVAITSAVAGLATAPIAAAHFNQIANYGLLANILTVPVMGILVMPFAVLAALLAPLGLSWVGLKVMEFGIIWILAVADWIANVDETVTFVISPNPAVLPLIAFGGLIVILWHGVFRFSGIALILAGFFGWSQTQRPDVLISASGGLIGFYTGDHRVLNKKRGDGFTARAWLQNDGDGGTTQNTAYLRTGFEEFGKTTTFSIGSTNFIHLAGKNTTNNLSDICVKTDFIIMQAPQDTLGPCTVIDQIKLRQTGSISIYKKEQNIVVETATKVTGNRLWTHSK